MHQPCKSNTGISTGYLPLSFAAKTALTASNQPKSKIQPRALSTTSVSKQRISFAAGAAQLADSTRATKVKSCLQHLIRNRFYDPHSGRFTSEDPIGFKADANFYRFVRNNPIGLTDPFGLCSCSDPCPSGEWIFDSVQGSAAVIGYGSLGIARITCKDNWSVSRWAHMGCGGLGIILGVGIGLDFQVSGTATTGPCKPEDLGNFTVRGYIGSIGPFTVGGPFGKWPTNYGIGKTIGLGYARVECHIHPF